MSCPIRLAPILSVLLVTIAVSLDAAEGSGRKGFVNGWQASSLRNQYRRSMHLDLGSVQDVEPLMLVRYDPGR